MYVELVEKSIKNRGKIVALNEVKKQPFDFERYITMFPFDKDILEYVKVNGTIRGYKGRHYCPMCIIDIDNEDVDMARQDCVKLVSHLVSKYKVNTSGLRIYFSGNKGFHLGIPLNVEPSEDVAERCKLFVKEISNIDCDMSIYEPHRIIRLPNSINNKSGLYKIPLTWDELNKPLKWILDRAKKPKEVKHSKLPNGLSVIFERIELLEKTTKETDFFDTPGDGERNNSLFKSACRLFSKGLGSKEVFKIVTAINNTCKNPLPEYEILTLIGSAEQKTGIKQDAFKPFGDFVQEWYDLTKPESNVIHLGFPKFDREMRGKLRGKLCLIAHYGGTRKSLLAQNISYFNIMHNHQRVAYSSMEMGVKDLFDRFIDMICVETNVNPHYEIEQKELTMPGIALKIVENSVAEQYNNFLFLNFSSSLDAEKYRKMLSEIEVDILVVDGLSMMSGTKTEDIDYHTQGLKEIAKEFNILVLLITHVSRGLKKHTRDVSGFLRGSEKIIDNCDFYICPSLLNDGEDQYKRDKGYLRLVNKRGSGNTVNLIYNLDCIRLLMTESDENPDKIQEEVAF